MNMLLKASAGALLFATAMQVSAALQFDLNCIKTGVDACSTGTSVGSITLENIAAGDIKVTIQSDIYIGTNGNLVKEVLLNLDPALSTVALVANVSSSSTVNGETLSPWSAAFDFTTIGSLIPNPAGGNSTFFTISATSGGSNFTLDELMFNYPTTVGAPTLYAAVHLQTCGGSNCPEGSLKVGASNPGEVPIPAAAWLFGSGLIGLAGMARRKKNA